MMQDLNKLTIGEAREKLAEATETVRELSALFGKAAPEEITVSSETVYSEPTPVLVCTDKRGVVFGYTLRPQADPITLTDARMCLYWSSEIGGVFGLTDKGPNSNCKISAASKSVDLSGVTAVFDLTDDAIQAWSSAPVQGR